MPLEGHDSFDARQFRLLQIAVGHRDEAGADGVAVIGRDDPAQKFGVPADLMDLGLQADVAIQVVMFGDALAVREDLWALCVLLGWDVAQLLEQRHVHVRLDIAGDTRIPIPVPGASHIGGLVDQPDALHAQFPEPGPDQKPAEAGADDRDVHLIEQGGAGEVRVAPGVFRESSKWAGDLDVLRDTVGS